MTITVSNDCLVAFDELKRQRKWKYVIYTLNDAQTQVTVVKTSKDTNYDHFLADLPADQCRWAVYDIEYTVNGVKNSKLVFIAWSPDACRIRQRMTYASAKDALRRVLVGVSKDVQATDKDEVSWEEVLSKVQQVGRRHFNPFF